MKYFSSITTFLFLSINCFSQQIELVRDINQLPMDFNDAGQSVKVNDSTFYLYYNSPYTGYELWKSNGTPTGTKLVKDIVPGSGSSSPFDFIVAGGIVYFRAQTPEHGVELWKTDGTEEGTVMVMDINPGTAHASVDLLIEYNNEIYFRATNGVDGPELWKSDGTLAGTVMVADLCSGSCGTSIDFPTINNGILYFRSQTSAQGYELWRTDGTLVGTYIVRDIVPGPGSSDPRGLISYHNELYFLANDGISGDELWKSDGTLAGTNLLVDINPGSASSFPYYFTIYNDTLFFTATTPGTGNELWKSDGTALGTTLVVDINPGAAHSSINWLKGTSLGLFLNANTIATGMELWKSNGTAASTVLVKDISLGTNGTSFNSSFYEVNGVVIFSAENNSAPYYETEVWRSDGTPAGTYLLYDIHPTNDSYPNDFVVLGNQAFFSANNGVDKELWATDGTTGGTYLMDEVDTTLSWASDPNAGVELNGNIVFIAWDGVHGREIWKTDGTYSGTEMLADIWPGTQSSINNPSLTELNGIIYFEATNVTSGMELWRTDGTPAGTYMLTDIYSGVGHSMVDQQKIIYNNELYFAANNGVNGTELWKTDGTVAGTIMVADIRPGASGSSINNFYVNNGILFFTASNGTNGVELWKTDGALAGTMLVKDIYSGSNGSNPVDLISSNDILYFRADNGTQGIELWRSDGTDPGTFLVKDVNPGAASGIYYLTEFNDTLFFFGNEPTTGSELWRSDGTNIGTQLVADYTVGTGGLSPYLFTVSGNTLFFKGNNSLVGEELYKYKNGQISLVKDIYTGTMSSFPNKLKDINGRLFFEANDGIHGTELWTSKGDSCNTYLVDNLVSGAGSSYTNYLDVIDDYLYLGASYAISYNNELQRLRLTTIESISPDLELCYSDTGSLYVNASSATSFQWQMNDGSGWSSISNGILFNNVTNDTLIIVADTAINAAQFRCLVYKSCSVDTSSSMDLTVHYINAEITGDDEICYGDTATLTGSLANSYQWSTASTLNSIEVNPSIDTDYILEVANAFGCSNADTFTVIVHSLPLVFAGNDTSVCIGSSVTLSGVGADTYTWSDLVLDNTPFTPTLSQYYTVNGIDANNCVNIDSVEVVVNSLPSVIAPSDTSICQGLSIILNGSGAQSYSWSGGITDGISFIPMSASTYIVTGTDMNGCSNIDSVSIILNTLPDITTNLSGFTIQANLSGANYQWYDCTNLNNISGANSQSFTPIVDGEYAVIIEGTNSCVDTSSCIVIVGLGIEDIYNTFHLYPNPTKDFVYINASETIDNIKIYDMRGSLVFIKQISASQFSIDMSAYARGIYIVQLMLGNNVVSKRIIKQ